MSFSDDFDNGWPEPEELEAGIRSMEILDRTFSWLVYGQAQNKPDDEHLRSLDREDLRRFLQTAPNSFEDAEFPVKPGVTDQFYARLEELQERVNALG